MQGIYLCSCCCFQTHKPKTQTLYDCKDQLGQNMGAIIALQRTSLSVIYCQFVDFSFEKQIAQRVL